MNVEDMDIFKDLQMLPHAQPFTFFQNCVLEKKTYRQKVHLDTNCLANAFFLTEVIDFISIGLKLQAVSEHGMHAQTH